MLDLNKLWNVGVGWGTKEWKFCLISNYVKSKVLVTLELTTKNRETECIPLETADTPNKIQLTYSERSTL